MINNLLRMLSKKLTIIPVIVFLLSISVSCQNSSIPTIIENFNVDVQKTKTINVSEEYPEPNLILSTEMLDFSTISNDMMQLIIYFEGEKEIAYIDLEERKILFHLFENIEGESFLFSESSEPCSLLISTNLVDEVSLLKYDLLTKKFNYYDISSSNGKTERYPKNSYDQKWVSYVEWTGQFFYDSAEFHTIYIKNIHDNSIIQLTKNGGSLKNGGEWSPTENLLAFSDNNEIFLFDLNSQTTQKFLALNHENEELEAFSWSPSGEKLLILISRVTNMNDSEDEIWFYDLKKKNLSILDLPYYLTTINNIIYWKENDHELFFVTKEGLVWFDLDTNRMNNFLNYDDLTEIGFGLNGITQQIPISKDFNLIGLVTDRKLYVYDVLSNTMYENYGVEIEFPIEKMIKGIIPTNNFTGCFK